MSKSSGDLSQDGLEDEPGLAGEEKDKLAEEASPASKATAAKSAPKKSNKEIIMLDTDEMSSEARRVQLEAQIKLVRERFHSEHFVYVSMHPQWYVSQNHPCAPMRLQQRKDSRPQKDRVMPGPPAPEAGSMLFCYFANSRTCLDDACSCRTGLGEDPGQSRPPGYPG